MYLDACMQRLWWIFRWTVATNGTREWWPAISVCGGSNTTFWTFHGQWNRQVWIATSLRSTVKSMKISSCVHNFTSSTDLKWHIVIVFQGSSSDWLCTTTSCIPQSVSALVVTYEHPNCAWCLVIDCLSLWQTWIQVLLHALWRVVNFLSWWGHHLFSVMGTVWKHGCYPCFPEACYAIREPEKGAQDWEWWLPTQQVRICTLSSSTYPSEPQLSQLMHQHHILNMVSLLCYKQTIQHSTVGWLCVVRWLHLCACCSCMCTSRSFWKPRK